MTADRRSRRLWKALRSGSAGNRCTSRRAAIARNCSSERQIEHRLGDAQRDDLLIGDPSTRVLGPLGQEIVDGAVNSDQQQIEVGVHRGPPQGRRLALQSTSDFDLLAYVPFPATTRHEAVAQPI